MSRIGATVTIPGVNDLLLYLMVGFVIVCVLLGVLRTRRRTPPAQDVLALSVDSRTVDLVIRLLVQDRKIQAIKALRESTGLGLADAKRLTDAIQLGHRPPPAGFPSADVRSADVRSADVPSAEDSDPPGKGQPTGPGPDLADRARDLCAKGHDTEAIRLVCDETGMGILDAQKFVRAL